jgi:hypothetical protein
VSNILGNGQIVPYREKLDTYGFFLDIVTDVYKWYNNLSQRGVIKALPYQQKTPVRSDDPDGGFCQIDEV